MLFCSTLFSTNVVNYLEFTLAELKVAAATLVSCTAKEIGNLGIKSM